MPINKETIESLLEKDDDSFNSGIEELLSSYAREKGFKTEEDIKGLVSKRDELIGKIKKLQKNDKKTPEIDESRKNLLTKLEEYSIMDEEDLEKVLSGQSSDKNPGSAEIERQMKRLTKQIETLTAEKSQTVEQLKAEKSKRFGSEKNNAILKALKNVHIKDDSIDILAEYFKPKATVEESDEGNVSVLAVDEDGLSPNISDYIQEWSKTDKAKSFIKAPNNTGGGAGGSSVNVGVKPTLADISKIEDRGERLKLIKEHGL